MRVKFEIHHPTGYPYVLYSNGKNYAIGATLDQAKRQLKTNKKPKVVSVSELIKKHGHSGAHNILAKFKDTWVCKNGMIFYE